jgi:hypothetical protein
MNRYIIGELWLYYHHKNLVIQIGECLLAEAEGKVYPFVKNRSNHINRLLTSWAPCDLVFDFRPYLNNRELYNKYVSRMKKERKWVNYGIKENGPYYVKANVEESCLYQMYKYWKREDLYRFILSDLRSLANLVRHIEDDLDADENEKYQYVFDILELMANLKTISKWELMFLVIEMDNQWGPKNELLYPNGIWSIPGLIDDEITFKKWLHISPDP